PRCRQEGRADRSSRCAGRNNPAGCEELPLPGHRGQQRTGRADLSATAQIEAGIRGIVMEHGRFEYSAIAKRPRLELPNGARAAVWVVPNVEHFHWGQPAMA